MNDIDNLSRIVSAMTVGDQIKISKVSETAYEFSLTTIKSRLAFMMKHGFPPDCDFRYKRGSFAPVWGGLKPAEGEKDR